jgi:peptide/nickel transport system substrate-binding protein
LSAVLGTSAAAAIAAAVIVPGATASAKSVKASTAAATPTLTWLMGTAPQSLDPGLDYTTQGSEFNSVVYTGLTAYKHANGTASTGLIPGLATALPKVSNGGKTYTATLRKGLKFSDGKPAKASDFLYTVERAIKIPWGGASAFITPNIVGATAYADNKAKTISGIKVNDSTGKIVIHLTNAYGPFDNVLAFPALGLIESGTPMKAEPSSPPAGIGPYMVTNIQPNASFQVVKNPAWPAEHISDIPSGHVNFNVKISSNVSSNALSVLNGSADIFDWADDIPGSLLSRAKASGTYKQVNLGGSTYYVFMNSQTAPFNNVKARQAVQMAVTASEAGFSRLASGSLAPGCFFLPPGVVGHGVGKCPNGQPNDRSLIAKAKQLVQASGQAATPITVWSETRTPRQQWMTYYASLLKQIGFTKVTLKVIADSNYFTTIGESKKVNPQTGFADWNQDFPNPIDFYGVLLYGKAIQPTDNENFGQTNDPKINAAVNKLGPTPATSLQSAVKGWQSIEKYVAKQAYVAVFGYQTFPFLTSKKVKVLYTSDIYGWDPTGITTK